MHISAPIGPPPAPEILLPAREIWRCWIWYTLEEPEVCFQNFSKYVSIGRPELKTDEQVSAEHFTSTVGRIGINFSYHS